MEQSYTGGTQLMTLKVKPGILLHFNWETVWVVFTIVFSPKSGKLVEGVCVDVVCFES